VRARTLTNAFNLHVEDFVRRADAAGHETRPPWIPAREFIRDATGDVHRLSVDLCHKVI
jgi:hypothetical protein